MSIVTSKLKEDSLKRSVSRRASSDAPSKVQSDTGVQADKRKTNYLKEGGAQIDVISLNAIFGQIGSVLAGRRVALICPASLMHSDTIGRTAKMLETYARTVLVIVETDDQYQDLRQVLRRADDDDSRSRKAVRVVSTSRQSFAGIGERGKVDIIVSVDSQISAAGIQNQKACCAPLLADLGYQISIVQFANKMTPREISGVAMLSASAYRHSGFWALNPFHGYSLEACFGASSSLGRTISESTPDYVDIRESISSEDHASSQVVLFIGSDLLKPPVLKHTILRSDARSRDTVNTGAVREEFHGIHQDAGRRSSTRKRESDAEHSNIGSRSKALSAPTMISARVRRVTEQRLGWSSKSQGHRSAKGSRSSNEVIQSDGETHGKLNNHQQDISNENSDVDGLFNEQKSLILSLREQLADVQSAQVAAKWTLDELKTQLIDLGAFPNSSEPGQGFVKADLVEKKTQAAQAAQAKLDALQKTKVDLEEKIDAIERKLMKSESKAMEAQRRATTAESKVAQLEIRLKRTKSEATALSKWAGELRGDLKDAKGESQIRPKTPEPEVNALKNDLSISNARVKELEERCDRLRIQADQAQSLVRNLKHATSVASSDKNSSDSSKDLMVLKKNLEESQKMLAASKKEVESLHSELRDAEQAKAELITLRSETNTLKKSLKEADSEIRDLQTYGASEVSKATADANIDINQELIKAATLHTEEIARWRSQVDELQASLDHMRMERAQVREKYMNTQREKIALEKKIENYRKESSQLGREVAKLQGELKKRQIMETDPNIESSTDYAMSSSRPRIEI